jgi:hypothetical protein
LPHLNDLADSLLGHPGQCEVVTGAVANDAGKAVGPAAAVRGRRGVDDFRCVGAYTRQIIIEHKGALISGVAGTTDAEVTGAEIAVGQVGRDVFTLDDRDGIAAPGAILPVRRDADPLFAQRVPPLLPDLPRFPYHAFNSCVRAIADRVHSIN